MKMTKNQKITIKRMRTELDKNMKWNEILEDKIKKKNQSRKRLKKIAIKRLRTKLDTKIKWNEILRDKIKK